VLAQIYLLDVEQELTDLRKTLRQHRVVLKELRRGGDLPLSFVRDLLAVLERLDRRLSTRLTNAHDNVTQVQQLLAAANAAEPPQANN